MSRIRGVGVEGSHVTGFKKRHVEQKGSTLRAPVTGAAKPADDGSFAHLTRESYKRLFKMANEKHHPRDLDRTINYLVEQRFKLYTQAFDEGLGELFMDEYNSLGDKIDELRNEFFKSRQSGDTRPFESVAYTEDHNLRGEDYLPAGGNSMKLWKIGDPMRDDIDGRMREGRRRVRSISPPVVQRGSKRINRSLSPQRISRPPIPSASNTPMNVAADPTPQGSRVMGSAPSPALPTMPPVRIPGPNTAMAGEAIKARRTRRKLPPAPVPVAPTPTPPEARDPEVLSAVEEEYERHEGETRRAEQARENGSAPPRGGKMEPMEDMDSMEEAPPTPPIVEAEMQQAKPTKEQKMEDKKAAAAAKKKEKAAARDYARQEEKNRKTVPMDDEGVDFSEPMEGVEPTDPEEQMNIFERRRRQQDAENARKESAFKKEQDAEIQNTIAANMETNFPAPTFRARKVPRVVQRAEQLPQISDTYHGPYDRGTMQEYNHNASLPYGLRVFTAQTVNQVNGKNLKRKRQGYIMYDDVQQEWTHIKKKDLPNLQSTQLSAAINNILTKREMSGNGRLYATGEQHRARERKDRIASNIATQNPASSSTSNKSLSGDPGPSSGPGAASRERV